MNCDLIRDLIPMYLDKTASNQTRKLVEAHLKVCDKCRAFAESCKATDKKFFGKAKDKILSKLQGEKVEIPDIDRQYACFSKKLKKKKKRRIIITMILLLGLATYVTLDIVKAVKHKKANG